MHCVPDLVVFKCIFYLHNYAGILFINLNILYVMHLTLLKILIKRKKCYKSLLDPLALMGGGKLLFQHIVVMV